MNQQFQVDPKDVFDALVVQRNEALDKAANLSAIVASLQRRIAELEGVKA